MPRITSLGQLPTPRLTPVPGVNHIPVYITRGTSDTLHMLPDILLIINKSGLHVASYASARCDLRDFAAGSRTNAAYHKAHNHYDKLVERRLEEIK